MQEIPQQVSEVLDVLAEKFGTTAAHLWEVLVRQAYVEGGLGVLAALFFSILSAYALKVLLPRAIAANEKARWPDAFTQGLVYGAALLSGLVAFACVLKIGYFLNPEYFALQEILKAVGG